MFKNNRQEKLYIRKIYKNHFPQGIKDQVNSKTSRE